MGLDACVQGAPYLCAWRSPCIPRRAGAESAGSSGRPRRRARRCPRCGCPRTWRPPPAARPARRSPEGRGRRRLAARGHAQWQKSRTSRGRVPAESPYLRLLPLGFALLRRLHLLVVVLHQASRQHVELLHPQRPAPLLRLLVSDLPPGGQRSAQSFRRSLRRIQRSGRHTHLEHELGCVQEVVGLPVELHRLQGFVLLQQVRGVLGEQRFDLLHVVGPGELHRFVPLRWIQEHTRRKGEV